MSQTYKTAIGKDLPVEKYVNQAGRDWMNKKGIAVDGATGATVLPQGAGKVIDKDTAQKFYEAAGGDKEKARTLAQQSGWKLQ